MQDVNAHYVDDIKRALSAKTSDFKIRLIAEVQIFVYPKLVYNLAEFLFLQKWKSWHVLYSKGALRSWQIFRVNTVGSVGCS
jgi:hypothetical protein